VISRRTLKWLLALLLLGGSAALRIHWEISRCREFAHQHAYHSSGEVVTNQANVTTLSADFFCQPGELEPWWARLIILGACASLIGVIAALTKDVWIWIRRVKI
jgi:hypothetical protein